MNQESVFSYSKDCIFVLGFRFFALDEGHSFRGGVGFFRGYRFILEGPPTPPAPPPRRAPEVAEHRNPKQQIGEFLCG